MGEGIQPQGSDSSFSLSIMIATKIFSGVLLILCTYLFSQNSEFKICMFKTNVQGKLLSRLFSWIKSSFLESEKEEDDEEDQDSSSDVPTTGAGFYSVIFMMEALLVMHGCVTYYLHNVSVLDEEEQTVQQPEAGLSNTKVFKVTCGGLAGTLHKRRFASGIVKKESTVLSA